MSNFKKSKIKSKTKPNYDTRNFDLEKQLDQDINTAFSEWVADAIQGNINRAESAGLESTAN